MLEISSNGNVKATEGVQEEEKNKDYSAELRGYQQAYSTEVNGGVFGLKIFVKMRERKLLPFRESNQIYDDIGSYARDIEKELMKNSALLDPTLPARKLECQNSFKKMFSDAGMETIFMEELPNGYMKDEPYYFGSPWFNVTTTIGHINIGARKRVINIDWSRTILKTSGKDLFPTEDVTKGGGYGDAPQFIHAWGREKATEYLKTIYLAATAGPLVVP